MKKSNKKVATSAQVANNEPIAVGQVVEQVAADARKARTERQQQAAERRQWLIAISAQFQAQRDLMELMGEPVPTINELIKAYYRKENGVTDLRTYDQWKEEGYQVRRGEKAFLVWGKPKSKQQKQAEPTTDEDEPTVEPIEQTTAKKDDFYPVCYLFDISQCHKDKVTATA